MQKENIIVTQRFIKHLFLNGKSGEKPGRKHLKAFTLIELLVVILIIGLLATIAVSQYKVAVNKSRYATLKDLVKSIATAQEIYFLANGEYATSFNELDIELGNSNTQTLTYDWGKCLFWSSTTDAYVMCSRPDIKLQYQLYLPHGPTGRNRDLCVSLDKTDTLSNQICQQETNNGGSYVAGNLKVWQYPKKHI